MNTSGFRYFLNSFKETLRRESDKLQQYCSSLGEVSLKRISERTKELEKQLSILRMQEAKEKALLESIGEGVIVFDRKGNILFANKASEQMLRIKSEDLLGQPITLAIPVQNEKGDPLRTEDRADSIALVSGKSTSLTHYYVRKDGSRFPVLVTVSPIIYDGKATDMVNTFRDITKETKLDRAKNEFVLLVSHQLRTPPTGIKWFTTMLLSEDAGPINETQREYLEEILYNNEPMIDIVGVMLSVSRIEMGIFRIKLQPTDISRIVDDVLSEIALQIADKNLAIEKHYVSPMPLISTDPMLLRIIFQNLIVNAVKYTPAKGKITITLLMINTKIHFSVQDTGFGIPEEEQRGVFTKFFRAGNAQQIDPSGTGLGLYIVKLIVSEIGGTISFSSDENKGTTFFVTLPEDGDLVHPIITV
jgi:PAS domain S-box-containing protein